MDKQFLTGYVKQISADDRTLTAYASTGSVDRDNEVILPSAWKSSLGQFMANSVLLWAHNYSIPPIGKVVDIDVDGHGLKFKAMFAQTNFADEIWELYKGGFLNTFSVGFSPKQWEDGNEELDGVLRTYTETELLEISAVPVPSNPHAAVERGVPVIAFKSVEELQLPGLHDPAEPIPELEKDGDLETDILHGGANTIANTDTATDTTTDAAIITEPTDEPILAPTEPGQPANNADNDGATNDDDQPQAPDDELPPGVLDALSDTIGSLMDTFQPA